jgi:hypothetical protein
MCSDELAVIERLLEKGADIKVKDEVRNQPPRRPCGSSHFLLAHCAKTLNAIVLSPHSHRSHRTHNRFPRHARPTVACGRPLVI